MIEVNRLVLVILMFIVLPHKQSFRLVNRNHPVCPSVQMSCSQNSSLTDEPVLMKHYIVAVNNLRMCMKENNPSPNYFKGDN